MHVLNQLLGLEQMLDLLQLGFGLDHRLLERVVLGNVEAVLGRKLWWI